MCDFAAWVGPIQKEDVEYLGLEMGWKNRDATGVSFTVGNQIKTLKGGVEADEFFASTKWETMWDTFGHLVTNGMVHCRIATHGAPEENVNNHPHFTESGSVLVHKGVVKPVIYMENAVSECDSEQLLRSLDFYGIAKGLKNVSGWAHIAYVPHYDRNRMYLYSNSSPLTYRQFENGQGDALYIVSTGSMNLVEFNNELVDSVELDLDVIYSLNLNTNIGELETWKRDATLNDTHKGFFGRSEKAFRSTLSASQ